MLRQAGVPFTVDSAAVDEHAVKTALKAKNATIDHAAETLAELKAATVSARHPQGLVIGADQMLVHQGRWFDKPTSRSEAAAHLRRLRGGEHELVTAAVVVMDGRRIWHYGGRARLAMRQFTDGFLESYLDEIGDAALTSVGAYRLEGRGAQLFSWVRGDHFEILGLPLLPLLDLLRGHGVVPT